MRTVSLAMPNGRDVVLEAPMHLYIPKILEQRGLANYEPDTLAAALAAMSVREGSFIDIGANVGVFSLLIAFVLERPCIAFEPLPDAAGLLETVVAKYGLPIEVSRVALSDSTGQAEFFVSAQTDSSSGLNKRFRPAKESITVQVGRLDEVLPAARPALIKIDTETTEPMVLAGSEATIDRERPYLIIEVLKGRTEEQIQKFFDGRGYSYYHIGSDSRWQPETHVTGDATYEFNNWLFAPSPLESPYWTELATWRERLASVRA